MSMSKTITLQIRETISRSISNLPDDWHDVVSIPVPTQKNGWTNTDRIDRDKKMFTKEILEPLAQYLAGHGFGVDFGGVVVSITDDQVYYIRKDWFKDTQKHQYRFNDDKTIQYEVRTNKRGNITGTTIKAKMINGTIYEVNAAGHKKVKNHTYLDMYSLCHNDITTAINHAISDNGGGHVMVRMTVTGSVRVTGSAN